MKMDPDRLLLYAVTPGVSGEKLLYGIEQALLGGATLVQLREKQLEGQALIDEAAAVKKLCDRYGVPLIINDNVELALRVDAAGVHLGPSDMPVEQARRRLGGAKIIGATARSVEQAVAAEKSGADYLGSGAAFPTTTKSDAVPMPRDLLREICRCVQIPVVAIGGIGESNVTELTGMPIAGVAVVAGIFGAEDVGAATKRMAAKVRAMLGKQGKGEES